MITRSGQKTVIITGAGGNLGQVAVIRFLKEGYRVVATVSPGKAFSIQNQNLEVASVDLTDESQVQAWLHGVVKKYPAVDAAVLLAGSFAGGDIEGSDAALLRKMIAVNFESAFFVSQRIFKQMCVQPSGGRIVLIASQPALEPKKATTAVAYAISKSMLINLAGILNAEGDSKNVVTGVVAPSVIDTPSNRQHIPGADYGRWVTPEEIVEMILFICNDTGRSLRDPIIKMYGGLG